MRVVVVGAAGRMGVAIRAALQVWPQATLVGAIDRVPSEPQGITTDLEAVLPAANVMIDFSSPQITAKNLAAAARHEVAALVGTTGLGSEALSAANSAAVKVPVIIAANTSLGATLLQELVRAAAKALPADFDIEIIEGHHRHKKDAPSGTALALGRAAAAGRGQTPESTMASGWRGESARQAGEIGFAVVRAGDIVGDHTVLFAGSGERVAISHQATDRAIFARGALQAAGWLLGRVPGRYEMSEVIGFKSII